MRLLSLRTLLLASAVAVAFCVLQWTLVIDRFQKKLAGQNHLVRVSGKDQIALGNETTNVRPEVKYAAVEPALKATDNLAKNTSGLKGSKSSSVTFSQHNVQIARVKTPVKTSIFVHDPSVSPQSRQLLKVGAWEPETQRVILDALQKAALPEGTNPYFFDLGANLGVFTMVAAAAGFHVMSFEPMMFNMELLNASVSMNGFHDRVTLFKTALSDKQSAPVCMKGTSSNNKGNGQVSLATSGKCGDQEQVQVNTVDQLVMSSADAASGRMCVSALKVDVEGYEAPALRGAIGVLRGECAPCVIAMEFIRKYSKRAASLQKVSVPDGNDVFRLLSDELGYVCTKWLPGQRSPASEVARPPWDEAKDGDYLCALHTPRCTGQQGERR